MKKREQKPKQLKKDSTEVKIGRILCRARLNKNYSLNDLYEITRIKPRYLQDLEKGDFSDLPGGFYVRAFIKKYADNVDINGNELLRRYNNKLPDLQDPHYMNRVSEDKLLVNAERQRARTRHSTIRKYIPLASLFVVIMLVLVGVWVVSSHYHNDLSTDSGGHSTTMSGLSSSKPVHKKRHVKKRSKSKKRPVIVHRQTLSNGQLRYHVIAHNHPVILKVMSIRPIQLSVKFDDKNTNQNDLKAKQIKQIKVPGKSKKLQLSVNNGSDLKARLNGKFLKFGHGQLIRSIIFKFSK